MKQNTQIADQMHYDLKKIEKKSNKMQIFSVDNFDRICRERIEARKKTTYENPLSKIIDYDAMTRNEQDFYYKYKQLSLS